jgi:hypothetical protein
MWVSDKEEARPVLPTRPAGELASRRICALGAEGISPVARRKPLDGQAIAIGIAEEHEPPCRGVLDVSDIYAGVAQLGSCGLDVVDEDLKSLPGPGGAPT